MAESHDDEPPRNSDEKPPRNSSARNRSDAREAAAIYRMHRADKERLRCEAAAAGLTMQQLFELRMFGEARPVGPFGRTRKLNNAEEKAGELPLAG
jgi:hypothetical protein